MELVGVLFTSIYFFVVFLIGIVLGSLLIAVKHKMTGRYLNRYYVVSYKGDSVYELHFSPLFGFYYAHPKKYFDLRSAAVHIFEEKYPDTQLYAVTVTLQDYYNRVGIPGILVKENGWQRFMSRQGNYFVILRNLANYRKRPGTSEWQWLHLLRRVKQTPSRKYWLIQEGNHHHDLV